MKVATFALDSGKRALLMRNALPSLETTYFVVVLQLLIPDPHAVKCDISRETRLISCVTQ
jgi:hypothetical protein